MPEKSEDQKLAEEREAAEREREKADERTVKASYTTVHPVMRNGELVDPGKEIGFAEGDAAHVRQLLAQGVIVEGKPDSKEVKEALGEAERRRRQQRQA